MQNYSTTLPKTFHQCASDHEHYPGLIVPEPSRQIPLIRSLSSDPFIRSLSSDPSHQSPSIRSLASLAHGLEYHLIVKLVKNLFVRLDLLLEFPLGLEPLLEKVVVLEQHPEVAVRNLFQSHL